MARITSYGTCELCGTRTSKAGMARHLASCVARNDDADGATRRLLRLRVQAADAPLYWLDLEIDAERSLADLDDYLRGIWLECCGHMSAFRVGNVSYMSAAVDMEGMEVDMGVRSGDVLAQGTKFSYEYDFGTSTYLKLRVAGVRDGVAPTFPRLLARNEAPSWTCGTCGAPATVIDLDAMFTSDEPFRCDDHAEDEDEDGWGHLPVVNSPRRGVCGYEG